MNHLKAKFTLGFFLCLLRRYYKRICHGQTHDPNLRIIGIEFNSLKNSPTSNKGFSLNGRGACFNEKFSNQRIFVPLSLAVAENALHCCPSLLKLVEFNAPSFLINGCAAIRMNCHTSGITSSFSFL